MNVSISSPNDSSGSTVEFVKMIKIKICPKVYVMYMVTISYRDSFSGHCRKTVVVEFPLWSCNSNTALSFMNMALADLARRIIVIIMQNYHLLQDILCRLVYE